MIDAERLQDAITLLPEELLAPVDALRKRKRISWKPIAAVAASFLLVVGLYHLQPMEKTTEAEFSVEDAGQGIDRGESDNKGNFLTINGYILTGKIIEVAEEHLVVTLADGQTATVFLDHLEAPKEIPTGSEIFMCFAQEPNNLEQLYPESILIE